MTARPSAVRPRRPTVGDGECAARAVAGAVAARAPSWFPELGGPPVTVEVAMAERRPASSSYVVRLCGPGGGPARLVFVKRPHDRVELAAQTGPGGGAAPRPRLVPLTPPGAVLASEVAATRAAERVFAAAGDPDLGVVRVLDALPEVGAAAFEHVGHPTLRDLLPRLVLRRPVPDLERGCANAGRWLRCHHGGPAPAGAEPRSATRDEVVDAIRRLADHLAGRVAGGLVVRRAAAVAVEAAVDVLPERLPLVPAHADFGVANVFVAPGGRVVVHDLLGAWLAPPWEDVAAFLTSLSTSRPVVLGRAHRAAGRLERAFLAGWSGGDPLLPPELGPFLVAAVLDKWTAVATRAGRGRRLADAAMAAALRDATAAVAPGRA